MTVKPSRSSAAIVSSTAGCSVVQVTRCFPFPAWKWAAPFTARLSDSVAPEVNTISFGFFAPISAATCSRAMLTASSAVQP